MSFTSFWSDLMTTIIGGIILAILFFFTKEKLFPLPKLTGVWYIEQKIQKTGYKPYSGMVLRFVIMLWCEGNRVKGTAEKIYEKSSTGERSFIGKDRTRATVAGYIDKHYFGKDKIYLHVVEDGHGRESTTLYEITTDNSGAFHGIFNSMVAEQYGTVKFQCNPY